MLLGARQGCVAGGEDLAEKMSVLKKLGFDFLELALTRDQIVNLTPDSAAEYQTMVEQTDLPILSSSMGHFTNFAAHSVDDREQIMTNIEALIQFTSAIGADAILLATSEAEEDVAKYATVYRQELVPVAEEAATSGVMLAMEHVGWYKPYNLAQLVRLISHPAIRIYFDMGNCLYVGENPIEQARKCAGFSGQLHAKGGPTTPLGAMPLVQVREILENAGFQGRVCLEIPAQEGHRQLAEARGLLKMAGYC